MSKADTWMPLYIGDYLADTMSLEAREHGAYLLLIMHYWRNGPLPSDDRSLAGIARVDRKTWVGDTGPIVRQFFKERDGKLHHKRIDKERAHADDKSEKKRSSGSSGGSAKWGEPSVRATRSARLARARAIATHTKGDWEKMRDACGNVCVRCGAKDVELVKDHITPIYQGGSDGIDNLQPLCFRCNSQKGPETTDHRPNGWRNAYETPGKMPSECQANAEQTPTPLPSPSQIQRKKESFPSERCLKNPAYTSDFEEWWAAYPDRPHDNKARAAKAYARALRTKSVSAGFLLEQLRSYRFGDKPQFRKMAATWLNECSWEDRSPTPKPTFESRVPWLFNTDGSMRPPEDFMN